MPTSKSSTPKRRVIVDYKNITQDILALFADRYPYGYDDEDIVKFQNAQGAMVKAVPFETQETKYLVKISVEMDRKIEAFMEEEEDDDLDLGDDEVASDTPDADLDD